MASGLKMPEARDHARKKRQSASLGMTSPVVSPGQLGVLAILKTLLLRPFPLALPSVRSALIWTQKSLFPSCLSQISVGPGIGALSLLSPQTSLLLTGHVLVKPNSCEG